MSRLVLGPFNRVEGDLELQLDVEGGQVSAARVNSPLFRGFEQILVGRAPLDALAIVPRICGICSVAQSAAAALALADTAGIVPAPNGRLARHLIQATENLADHLTHFYLFFMPDFARSDYAHHAWHGAVSERFAALNGTASGDMLPARAGFLRLMGFLAGRWPHTLALQPGGTTRAISSAERIRVLAQIRDFRAFLEKTLFGDALEAVAALGSIDALQAWAEARQGDFPAFLRAARTLRLEQTGRACDRFLSFGAYDLLPPGLLSAGMTSEPLDIGRISEDHRHAWLYGSDAVAPANGHTRVAADKADAYTWCKAPRYAGQVAETGALARQLLAGHPLLQAFVASHGGSVTARISARMIELASLVPAMESWARQLTPGEAFCTQGEIPDEADGVGLTEAARGSLGHWLSVRHGRIARYQIIAPTTWNFSPRDAAGQPGPLEQALVGLPAGEGAPPLIQHVVRSFDPCMVCTVH
ncbi:nickel-dependent hydrogenase large subunit [Zoogloea sp.]|uniref:nickel-dependent hydrogenase large subunit n=1 Tax=Zoogloea sp. TaxID=49181 RepID=UPI001AD105B0|nr:nickel-dependent hydrogenase large subunit [Zoogloea sp.]MBN8284125.1 nickel-dependent hydrogenase large subunit [Zoogloea sp.]